MSLSSPTGWLTIGQSSVVLAAGQLADWRGKTLGFEVKAVQCWTLKWTSCLSVANIEAHEFRGYDCLTLLLSSQSKSSEHCPQKRDPCNLRGAW